MSDEVDKYCMTKGFIFQPSFFKQISRKAKITDRERAYRYICEYMFSGKLPDMPESDILADFWDGTYPTLHKVKALVLSKLKDDTTEDTSPSTSGSTTKSTSGDMSPSTSRSTSIKDNGNGKRNKENGNGGGEAMAKDIYNTAEGAAARTDPPTLEQAEEYARAEGIRTNVRKFHSYYSARRWIFPDGEPVRDWKALLITWASRDREDEKPEPEGPKPPAPFDKCPACGGSNVSQHFNYAMCNDPKCQKSYTWNGKAWRQDA